PQASALVTVTDVKPTASLVKVAAPTSVNEPGGNVAFTVTVTNTDSAESLTLNSLNDNVYGDLTTIAGSTCAVPQTLAKAGSTGDTYTCTFTGTVGPTPRDYKDVVTATLFATGHTSVPPQASAIVTVTDVKPTASLVKV